MVFARVADFLTPTPTRSSLVDDGGRRRAVAMDTVEKYSAVGSSAVTEQDVDDEAARPPYIHVSRKTCHGSLEETDEAR